MPFCKTTVRDFELSGRSEAFGTRVMASTSHPLATLAALDVLRRGGNAMDAAVAAVALLGVVEATQTGIGGDCFVLYMRCGQEEVIALNGSGWAPAAASLDRYVGRGMTSIPSNSPDAVTVPGAVASWAKLIEDHGTMKLAELLQPAIAAAEDGYPVTERVARDWARQLEKLRKNKTTASIFLPNGSAPRPGDIHRQPALAAALRSIAADGPAAFYKGWIARDMVDALRDAGGCHTLEDFSTYAPEYVTPIATNYRGYQVWECPPNGQGVVPLAMLKALEGFDASAWAPVSVERWHVLTEIGRQVYADRDCFVGDPRTGEVPLKALLSDKRSAKLRERVAMDRRTDGLAPFPIPDHCDTAFLTVVDADRNTVAFINSIFDDFGSGIVSPAAGVIFHNRACGFVLEPGHPNAIAGRKRPLNTIISRHGHAKGKSSDAVRRHRRPVSALRSGRGSDQYYRLPDGNSGGDRRAADFCPRRYPPGRKHGAGVRRKGTVGPRPPCCARRKPARDRTGDLDRLGGRPPSRRRGRPS